MTTLIIAYHDNKTLSLQNLHVAKALDGFSDTFDVAVVGYKCQDVADQAAKIPGCSKVLYVDNINYQHFLAESMTLCLQELVKGYATIVFASNTFSKNILPRLAAKLDISPITDVCKIIDKNTFSRPIYAGNAICTLTSNQDVNILSIRTASFLKKEFLQEACAKVDQLSLEVAQNLSEFKNAAIEKTDRPDLTNAKIVVSGGRGLSSKENFALIEKLADKLGAAIGASRAAVDAGFVANDYQVGQTGKIISPDVYIAIGISGAIQHLAGMKDSRIIIAINNDADAPIFGISDYAMEGDLFEVVPELIQWLDKK